MRTLTMPGSAGLLAAMLLLAAPALASEQRIGAAAAVVPDTSGVSVSGVQIEILDGSEVFRRQRVLTESEGRAQLIFLDGSAITVGPRSDVTLDEFVYDPDSPRLAGATINASRGVLRYVGGKISKTADVAIRTPSATIGIRGGIVVVDIAPDGRTNAYFLYGEHMTVSANGGTEVARRAGSVISHAPGQAPQPARLASPGEMRQALNGLQAGGRAQPAAMQPRQAGGNQQQQPPQQQQQQQRSGAQMRNATAPQSSQATSRQATGPSVRELRNADRQALSTRIEGAAASRLGGLNSATRPEIGLHRSAARMPGVGVAGPRGMPGLQPPRIDQTLRTGQQVLLQNMTQTTP